MSKKLADDSKDLVWGAKKLNRMALLRKYAPIVGGVSLMVFFFWIRFYLMI